MYCDGVSLVIMDNTELACSHRAHDKITLAKSHGKNSPGSPLLHDPVAFCGPVQLLLWNRRLGMKRRNVFVQSFSCFAVDRCHCQVAFLQGRPHCQDGPRSTRSRRNSCFFRYQVWPASSSRPGLKTCRRHKRRSAT